MNILEACVGSYTESKIAAEKGAGNLNFVRIWQREEQRLVMVRFRWYIKTLMSQHL